MLAEILYKGLVTLFGTCGILVRHDRERQFREIGLPVGAGCGREDRQGGEAGSGLQNVTTVHHG